jgi:uncharacterized membrane protein
VKRRISLRILVVGCLVFVAWAQSGSPNLTITKFDVPGAGKGANQGTLPFGIVDDGSIVGEYYDSNSVLHGFLRNPSTGEITKINYPGSQYSLPEGMNSALTIVGFYADSAGVFHAYRRTPSGKYTTIDYPGASGSTAYSINDSDKIVGSTLTRMARATASC